MAIWFELATYLKGILKRSSFRERYFISGGNQAKDFVSVTCLNNLPRRACTESKQGRPRRTLKLPLTELADKMEVFDDVERSLAAWIEGVPRVFARIGLLVFKLCDFNSSQNKPRRFEPNSPGFCVFFLTEIFENEDTP